MWHAWDWSGGGWGWFGLMHVVWWVLLVVGIIVVVRALSRSGRGNGRDRAMDILRERYARGEIDQAEYAERSQQLRS